MRNCTIYILCGLFFIFGCDSEENKSGIKDLPKPEAFSLLGKSLFPIKLSTERKAHLDSNLTIARTNYDKNPDNPENIIWLGRRLAYLMRYRDAIKVYSRGIEKYPENYKLYRHRGHRYISIREFDKAIADLEKATKLIIGVPDQIEPDGAPNKYNIPTSTSHSNIWYHLGLAYYLKSDFENALRCYLECIKFSQNNDMLCATSDWLYMTYRRLGREKEANQVLNPITVDMKILENHAYHIRLLMYKGEKQPGELLDMEKEDALEIATYGYGIANWYYYNGQMEKAKKVFNKITEGEYWPAFGYIAAEADLKRLAK